MYDVSIASKVASEIPYRDLLWHHLLLQSVGRTCISESFGASHGIFLANIGSWNWWRKKFWCHANAKYPDSQSTVPVVKDCPLVPRLWPKESAVGYKHPLLRTRKGGNEHSASWNGLVRSWWLWLPQVSWHTRHMCILDVSVCQWLRGRAMRVRVEVQGVSVNISVCSFRTWCWEVSCDSCSSCAFCGILPVDGMGVH